MSTTEPETTQPALWEQPGQSPARRDGATGRSRTARRPGTASGSGPVGLGQQRPTAPMEFSVLWSIEEVANYLGVPKQTIYSWRTTGYGPQGFRVGKHLRWRAATVISWTVEMEHGQ